MQKINARPRNHLLMPAKKERFVVGTIQPNSFNFQTTVVGTSWTTDKKTERGRLPRVEFAQSLKASLLSVKGIPCRPQILPSPIYQ
jgi:hypothetical protein